MRKILIIPAPARAYQFTMTVPSIPEMRAITAGIFPTEISDYTQAENRFPRVPDKK